MAVHLDETAYNLERTNGSTLPCAKRYENSAWAIRHNRCLHKRNFRVMSQFEVYAALLTARP